MSEFEKKLDDDTDDEDDVPELDGVKETAAPVVEEDATLTNSDVITKYLEAAKIAQSVLIEVIKLVIHSLLCKKFASL
jgi:hypothetical protein